MPNTSTATAAPPDLSDYLTTAQAAAALGVVRSRVLGLIYDGRTEETQGRLPAQKMGDQWMIRRQDLELVRVRKPGKAGWACNRGTDTGGEDGKAKT